MKEFRVEIRVKNNLLYTAIDRAGYDSVAAFSRASGVQQSVIGELLNMSAAPINKAGKWRPPVLRMARALKSLPEDLFPADYLRDTLKNNRVVREYSAEEIRSEMYLEQATPEALMIQADALDTINDAMALLPERHRDVLRMRFGMDGYREHTMEEVAKVFGVTRERIRQIELNAIRRLKAPKYRLSPELLSVDAA